MILWSDNGAILEVFWRQRGARPWSEVTAQHFLSRFQTDRVSFQGARWLLSDRADTGRAWRAPDPAVVRRSSSLIASRRVIVAQFGGGQRWPGSGFILGSGPQSTLLFWRDQLHLLRDLQEVKDWLGRMQAVIARVNNAAKNKKQPTKEEEQTLAADKRHIAAFRKLLESKPGIHPFNNLNDYDFLKLVITYFDTGELLPIYHRYPGIADPDPPDGPPDKPGPIKPPGKDDPDDPNDDPFIPGVCLLRAAKNGTPFVTIPEAGGSGEDT